MPWRVGWKHEYWDGHAHLTPRQHHVHVCVYIEAGGTPAPTPAPHHPSIRVVGSADASGLVQAFIGSFQDGVEFCDWPVEKVREHARRNITDFFSGRRGIPLISASRLAVDERGRILGAALLVGREEGPALDLLMVRPGSRRRGIARALVGAAVEELRERGATGVLRSAYCIANEESTRWHRAFGFEEEPDLHLARLRRAFYAHEASRYEVSKTREHLRSSYEHWDRRTDELEQIAECEGFEAVMPSPRYRW